MNKAFKLFVSTLFLAAFAFAQTTTTSTTLSVAMGRTDTTVTLTSATGVTAASGTNAITGIFIDREFMTIGDLVSGTTYKVKRNAGGIQSAHTVSAVVWVGPISNGGVFDLGPSDRTGACTASQNPYLPVIQVRTGGIQRCIAGRWVSGVSAGNATMPYTSFSTISPASGVAGTSTSQVAGTIWFSQLFIPVNSTLTGACVRNGATVTTDKYIVALYDSTGVLLANSATAGTTTAGVSIYQCVAFTATVQVAGPQSYFVAIQTNGTTDNFLTYAAGSATTNYGTQNQTGTFGTLPAMTTPTTTFTAGKGPMMSVY
jgi:hypothetical protein